MKVITTILEAAAENNKAGPVAQHLVGAKLQIRLPEEEIANHNVATKDDALGRRGDFEIGNTVFHVTMHAMESHYSKCLKDVKAGCAVYLLVPQDIVYAEQKTVRAKYSDRIQVRSIEEFIAQNIDEMGRFDNLLVRHKLHELITVYNKRVSEAESDMSLLIEPPDNLSL